MAQPSDPPLLPTELRRFQVLEEYAGGEGWSGAVRDGTGPIQVLKVFAEEGPHEASLLASLVHPRIPRVLEAGKLADGRGYLIREHLAGEALDLETVLDVEEAQALAIQLLEVLAFIHPRGVCHFDLKPANLLRRATSGEPDFALLDFGLGGRARDPGRGGTPFFSAPERSLGLPGDGRSDLFSLGVLLYTLTRSAATPLPLERYRRRFPDEDFLTAVGATAADLPGPLREWLPRLLARRPADRFPDAEEALEALAGRSGRPSLAALRPDPIPIYGDAVLARIRTLPPGFDLRIVGADRETRASLALHAVATDGSATGIALPPGTSDDGDAVLVQRGADARNGGEGTVRDAEVFSIAPLAAPQLAAHLRSVFQFDQATGTTCADQLLRAGCDSIPAVETTLRGLVANRAVVPEGSHWIWPDALSGRIALDPPPALPPDPERIRRAATGGQIEAAMAAYRSAQERLDPVADRSLRAALAEGLLLAGEPARCLPLVADLPIHQARALVDLGRLASARSRLDAVAQVPAAELLATEADRIRARAILAFHAGHAEEALELLAPIADSVPGQIARSLVLRRLSRNAEALASVTSALERIDPSGQPFLFAAARTSQADCLRAQGDLGAARAGYEEAMRVLTGLGHVRHSATAATNLGVIAKDQGEFDLARRYQRQARGMFDHVDDQQGWAAAQANYGILDLAAGDPLAARRRIQSAIAAFERLGATQSLPRLWVELAKAHHASGEPDTAITCLDRAATATGGDPSAAAHAEIATLRAALADHASPHREPTRTMPNANDPNTDESDVPKEVFRTYLAINRRLAGEADLDRAMTYLLDAAVTLTGGRSGYLLVVRDDGLRRELRCGDSDAPAIAFSRSMVHRAIRQRRTQTAEDALADQALTEMASVRNLRSRSALCAPFHTAAGHQGALYVEHPGRARMFGEREKEHLEILADQAAIAVDRMIREEALSIELQQSRHELHIARRNAPATVTTMLGESAPIRELRDQIERVAGSDLSVLIRGETGSGKELVARALHQQSGRARGPFVAENCSAIPGELMESEFFGHCKGSFTGADADRAGLLELASGGTLFLDEIGDMPMALQVKLLRALQEAAVRRVGGADPIPVDLRLVSATHRDPRQLIDSGAFREDLYFRVAAIEIQVPPLRERGGDILLLAESFLDDLNTQHRRQVRLSAAARSSLQTYPWPGNVRELHHVLARAFLLADREFIDDLALPPARDDGSTTAQQGTWPAIPLKEAEARTIRAALRETDGDKTKAARLLQISRTALYEKLRRMAAPQQD